MAETARKGEGQRDMKIKNIKGTHVTIGGIIAVFAVAGSVYAAADKIGFALDKPAWQSDITVLAEAIQSIQKSTDQREILRLQQLEDDLVFKIATAAAKGEPPNPLDVLKLQQIRRQIDALKEQNQ